MQKSEQLVSRIAKLNPTQQAVVEKLVQNLEAGAAASSLTLESSSR